MDYNTPDLNSWPAKFVLRVSKKIRSDKKFREETIKKNEEKAAERRHKKAEKYGNVRYSVDTNASSNQDGVNELGEREISILSQATTLAENRDHTDLMHRLAHHDSFDSLVDNVNMKEKLKDPYFDSNNPDAVKVLHPKTEIFERQFETVPDTVWQQIADNLSPSDAASLSLASKTLHAKLGTNHLQALDSHENRHHKHAFLNHLDRHYPRHLLCFPCGKFHLRSQPGKEKLMADYVNNPLYDCPNTRDKVLPRLRLTHGRELPYSYVQLAVRRESLGEAHGIDSDTLSRRWRCKDSEWTHHTRYIVHDDRLLMRVVSSAFVLPSQEMTETRERHLLYDREEYLPFFSVCAHWKDGELMNVCKCAMSHVPAPPESYFSQLKKAPKIDRARANPNFLVRGCDDCRPARRCPECPTEYLVEIQMREDKNDPVRSFKHAIVVTRWSDLGDGKSPHTSAEYAAIQGTTLGEEYDSFNQTGRRAVSGIFESRVSGSVPGQRMISLNPKNEKWGDEGHGWY